MKKYAKIVNQLTHEVMIGKDDRPNDQTQTLWKNWGFSLQNVEQSSDGRWFLAGYVPKAALESDEEVKRKRAAAYEKKTDCLIAEYVRKNILGLLTAERKEEIETELKKTSLSIQALYPYRVSGEKQEENL